MESEAVIFSGSEKRMRHLRHRLCDQAAAPVRAKTRLARTDRTPAMVRRNSAARPASDRECATACLDRLRAFASAGQKQLNVRNAAANQPKASEQASRPYRRCGRGRPFWMVCKHHGRSFRDRHWQDGGQSGAFFEIVDWRANIRVARSSACPAQVSSSTVDERRGAETSWLRGLNSERCLPGHR